MSQNKIKAVVNKTIGKYYKNRIKNIQTIIQKPAKKYNANTFHILRVEIKKFKALKELAAAYHLKLNSQKKSKFVNSIFKLAGKVRSIQIELKLLETDFKSFKIPGHLKSLKEKLNAAKNQYFNKVNNTKINLTNQYKTTLKKIETINLNQEEKFIRKQIQFIRKLLKAKDPDIHQVRIKIKKLIYCLKIINTNDNNPFLLELKSISEIMGNWHDIQMIKENMIDSLLTQKDNFTFTNMTKILIKINKQISNEEIKIINKFSDLSKMSLLNE